MHYARRRSTFLFVLTINVYLFLEIYIINGAFVQDMTCAFLM